MVDAPDDALDPLLDLGFETPRRAPYYDGLREHLDLVSWLTTPLGVMGVMSTIYTIVEDDLDEQAKTRLWNDAKVRRDLAMDYRDHAARLQTIYVAPNFVSLSEAAKEGMPPYEFRLSDILQPDAFYYLARPVQFTFNQLVYDEDGELIEEELRPHQSFIRALTTQRIVVRDGSEDMLRVTAWAHSSDTDLQDADTLEGTVGSEWRQHRWLPLYTHQIDGSVLLDTTYNETVVFVVALNLLMNQKLGYMRGVKPPRTLRKQAERTSPDFGDIIVAHVRRRVPRNPHDDLPKGDAPDWSHRWVVRGFWRNQWFPSEQRHKPVWINPYIKGPADRPLIVKDKIIAVDR